MSLFRWYAPPFFTRASALGLALLTMAAASARGQPSEALAASDPFHAAASLPLRLPPPDGMAPPQRPADIAQAREIWQHANQRVAEFPRGHIDLLKWETAHPPAEADGQPPAGEAPLGLAETLRLSLRHRPELFTHPDMSEHERAAVRVAYAAHVRELRHAWIDAVAARQSSRYQSEILDATRTASELGWRMVGAGNWSQARLMREQLTQASAWQATVDAQLLAMATRERLARLLGLWNAQAIARLGDRLPESLPVVPPQLSPGAHLDDARPEAAVLRGHPTLAAERLEAQRQFSALGTSRGTDWTQAVNAALQALPDPDRPGSPMPEPPHIGHPSLLRDHPLQRAIDAESGLLRRAAERRSMARLAWAQLQARHAGALHAQDGVAQLRAALEQESLLRYNGMLQSTWELLASARERMRSLDNALQAQRDFWRAQADWQAVLAGARYTGPGTPSSPSAATAAPAGH